MADYMTMQKLWWDSDLIELKIVCSSDVIKATTKIYVSDELIDDLISKIKMFLDGQVIDSYWANECPGDDSTVCVELRFLRKDKLGHILIEVYMELNDGGKFSKHNCCFYLNTEIGLLAKFCDELPRLKQAKHDVKVVLNGFVSEN